VPPVCRDGQFSGSCNRPLKVLKVLKVLNFSGAGWCRIFTFTFTRRGQERSEPAAVHQVPLGRDDLLNLTCRLVGLLPDVVAKY
jgi:hypothetical protein